MKTDNVALMVHLAARAEPVELVVVNLHLHWNPEHDVVKYSQLAYVLEKTRAFRDKVGESVKTKPRVVVCGDFNSRPESPLLQMI